MDELSLGALDDLVDGEPTLRKAGGRRFACVRRGDAVHVLDDRCPHEGYPLSQGTVRDGVLTCCWHNWKFDLSSGECTFGGEGARSYEARVDGKGLVVIDTTIDPAAERRKLEGSLRRGMRDGTMGSVMRDALRLGELDSGSLEGALATLASDAARRAPWGFEHGLAMLADGAAWIEDDIVHGPDAFAALSSHVIEPLLHAPERELVDAKVGTARDVLAALDEERREDAEGIARHLVREGKMSELYTEAIVPWLARDLTDYGHGAIFATKARELAERFTHVAEDVVVALIVASGWATFDSGLPGWRPTHDGTREARAKGSAAVDEAYVERVLVSEREAVGACLARLAEGIDPRSLILAGARAAAERIRRFDDGWERREDAPVTVLQVSHLLTFAEAALALSAGAEPDVVASYAVQVAGFVGKLHTADGAPTEATLGGSLEDALARRDLPASLGTQEPAAAHYAAMAEFSLHHAFVRPIFAAHAIKTTEAARRLERLDPANGPVYRAALGTVTIPRRPERFFTRTASIASSFVADGRPPPGLY